MDKCCLKAPYADTVVLGTRLEEATDPLHHFSVTAACFLGFSLKKSIMAAMVPYVANTHWRNKKRCGVNITVTQHSH